MKKLLALLMLLFAVSAEAQQNPYPLSGIYAPVDPTTTSCLKGQVWVNTSTNHVWHCNVFTNPTTWFDSTASGSSSFPMLAPDGTTAAPSYSFTNFPTAGLLYDSSLRVRLQGRSGSGTDVAGGQGWFIGGASTGTAAGGDILIGVTPGAAASSSTLNGPQATIRLFGAGHTSLGGASVNTGAASASTWSGANITAGRTDVAGGDLVVRPGAGTGTGAGGSLTFSVAPAAGSTGSTVNAFANAIVVTGAATPTITANYQLLEAVGTEPLPSYAFTGFGGSGLSCFSGGCIPFFSKGGVYTAYFDSTSLHVPSTSQFRWGSGTAIGNSADTGLARTSAGVVKITDGSSGFGRLYVADGTQALPSLSFSNFTSTGLWAASGPILSLGANNSTGWQYAPNGAGHQFFVANVEKMRLNGTVLLNLETAYQLTWGTAIGSADTGLSRVAAAVVKATNGSSGDGTFRSGDGLVSVPAYGFVSSTNSGLYYDTTANDAVGVTKGGITRVFVTGDRTLTDAAATTIFQVAIADAAQITLQVDYSVQASNATPDYTAITGTFYVAIVNKAGTETCSTITEAGETSVGTGASTLTFTATCDTSPSNAVNIQVNSDSSLTTPTIIGQFIIHRSGSAGAITLS